MQYVIWGLIFVISILVILYILDRFVVGRIKRENDD